MRIWTCCIFMLLVSTLCRASPASTWSLKAARATILTVIKTPAVEHQSSKQYCDQLEDTEAVSAVYTQYNIFSPVLLAMRSWLKPVVYPLADNRPANRRDNARIPPFCRLILFPFHGFW